MSDDLEKELDHRQNLIVAKLAELGITVQLPVPFVKIPSGPIGGQISFVWEDSAPVQQALDDADEFTQMMNAQKEMDAAEREEQRKKDEATALEELAALADGLLDDDD